MSGFSKIAFACFALIACAAWTINVEPISVSVGGLSQTRPQSDIGPNDRQKPPWREIHIDIDQAGLRSLSRWEPTFHLTIDDCAGKVVSIEGLYIDGKSIERIRSDGAAMDALRATDNPVRLTAFLLEKVFQDNAQICASLSGGNMLGGAVKQHCFRLKPEPAQAFGIRAEAPPRLNGELASVGLCGPL
ncbi:hypothetical protein IZ6_08450 [Terrihabitans soli]|uniref:Uncharacterized protein n=1 Tax=Terrihabitans soli TaxID=708113 RepID=A0A6S6QT38_9HYPH|nr:hypothetical protein [Terrihabitans soli]BCJ90110.1 hypothetical protein IZ6_08450 [Terrihabitans soli]